MSSTLEEEESELIKEPKAQWFFGDVIKRDSREYKTVPTSTKPTVWTPFTEKDSNEIEKKYISFTKRKIDSSIEKSNFKVAVQEDYLSEVDLETLELYSVYWPGPVYEVRRGFWFCAPDGKTFIPCNENLCRQVEAGFWKYKPWKKDISIPGVPTSFSSSENIDQVPSEEKSKPPSTSSAVNSAVQKHATDKPELRWALFGPYMNQYVIYHSQSVAFLLSDLLSSKIYRGVMETISKGENLGGVRLVRGWDEVNKLKKPIVISPSSSVPTSTSPVRSKEKAEDEQNDKSKIEAPRIRSVEDLNLREEKEVKPTSSDIENVVNDFINSPRPSSNYLLNSESEDRQIDHLIFVIHGIGQKLGERIDSISLVNDCNMLRSTLKSSSKLVRESMVELNVPDGSGVQVLPIQWRQKVQFGTSDKLNKNSKNSDNETDATWSTDAGDVSGSAVKKKPSKVLDEKLERVADTASLENITLDGVPSIRFL
ncbi:hypothetical protein HK099_008576 [Clydaea vesicula]|uniref:DDHD domain-containing protein n=1 Tax=Clydaea vesicula TaxID=447962 RepID=A0AAD5U638_9FUNG|nr:hypothetical protein HK099_008576 [Clydaea vesicula]